MTNAEIKKQVDAYFTRTLEDYRADAEDARADGIIDAEGLSLHLSDLEEALAEGEHVKAASDIADAVLACARERGLLPSGAALEKGSHEYRVLCRETLKGIIAATRLELKGRKERPEAPEAAARLQQPVPPPIAPDAGSPLEGLRPADGELLSKLISDFVSEGVTSGRWKGRTKGEAEGVLGAFLRIVGDRGVKTLDRRVLTTFRDTLIRWPSNINKKARYRGRTVKEILAMGADSPLSTTSVNKHLTYTQGFVRWCVASGYLSTNVAANLTISKRNVKASSERQPYDTEDLRRLLSSPIYHAPDKKRPSRYWIPLICLFSGCRLGEAAQLHVSDIRTVDSPEEGDGIPCFDFNAIGDKNLKTASSARTVPIHSSLLELGLLAYVEKLKKEGKPRLWMDLKLKREGYGQDVGRWFQRYGRKHISADKRKSLHSMRHTFITALNRAHVPEAIVAELAGHAHGNIDRDRYGHGFEAGQLKEAIERVNFGVEAELKKLPRLG